ncbi:hypothetical protein LCGC14_0830310 [marine sediment metagenome]|uniref:Sialidase domain-containing protein n=1 Tax=marine sediment metagenome TaxID=412755 RepID=A0A0F9SNI8_9ZZZZ
MSIDNIKVNTTTAENSFAFEGNRHCLVRSAGNRYWALYLDSSGVSGDMLVAYSDDSGATWTEETAVASARAHVQRLNLMIDSSDIPIIVYEYDPASGNTEIRYVDRSGGSWGSPETVHTRTVTAQYPVRAVIDANDAIHIAYRDSDGDTDYITGTAGSWSSPEEIDDSVNFGDIAVNSSNEPVVTFLNFVRHRTGGAWAAASTFDDQSASGHTAVIAIDSSDNWIVVWDNSGAPTSNVYYRKYTGSWGTTLEVTSDAQAVESGYSQPILILDTSDDAYVIYAYDPTATDETIWYKKIASGTVGPETILSSAITHPNNETPTFTGLWHKYPPSGVLPAAQCPTVILLDESGATDADLKFFALEATEEKGTIYVHTDDSFRWFGSSGKQLKIIGHETTSDQDILAHLLG